MSDVFTPRRPRSHLSPVFRIRLDLPHEQRLAIAREHAPDAAPRRCVRRMCGLPDQLGVSSTNPPYSDFSRSAQGPSGFQTMCRECASVMREASRKKPPESIAKPQRNGKVHAGGVKKKLTPPKDVVWDFLIIDPETTLEPPDPVVVSESAPVHSEIRTETGLPTRLIEVCTIDGLETWINPATIAVIQRVRGTGIENQIVDVVYPVQVTNGNGDSHALSFSFEGLAAERLLAHARSYAGRPEIDSYLDRIVALERQLNLAHTDQVAQAERLQEQISAEQGKTKEAEQRFDKVVKGLASVIGQPF